jgi:hypothetical protein
MIMAGDTVLASIASATAAVHIEGGYRMSSDAQR